MSTFELADDFIIEPEEDDDYEDETDDFEVEELSEETGRYDMTSFIQAVPYLLGIVLYCVIVYFYCLTKI